MTKVDYDKTWIDLSLVIPPLPAWEHIPEYHQRGPDESMADRGGRLFDPNEPAPHQKLHDAFIALSEEDQLNRWPAILEELNDLYEDVARFDEERGQTRSIACVFAEIRDLIERRVRLAARARLAGAGNN